MVLKEERCMFPTLEAFVYQEDKCSWCQATTIVGGAK